MVSELHLPKVLENVIFLERPLNAVSLTSAIGTTLRARRRQRQVRDHMAERAASTETLRQLNETLEARVAERTEALRASEAALAQSQKMEAVGRLTGGIAHDFNNLLAAVVGNLELLQLRVASDERALQLAGAAFQAAMRGTKPDRPALGLFTNPEARPRCNRRKRRAARHGRIAGAYGRAADRITPAAGPSRPSRGCRCQLELAILNLAINARDAMPEGGRLTIATGRQVNTPDQSGDGGDELGPGRYVVISVADTGSGMPPEVLARAMEPFFTTKGIGQGTGLGLSQVYGIARQSGGDVRIESSAGRGTAHSASRGRAGSTAGWQHGNRSVQSFSVGPRAARQCPGG
jgi:signal transduction histidine kinase